MTEINIDRLLASFATAESTALYKTVASRFCEMPDAPEMSIELTHDEVEVLLRAPLYLAGLAQAVAAEVTAADGTARAYSRLRGVTVIGPGLPPFRFELHRAN